MAAWRLSTLTPPGPRQHGRAQPGVRRCKHSDAASRSATQPEDLEPRGWRTSGSGSLLCGGSPGQYDGTVLFLHNYKASLSFLNTLSLHLPTELKTRRWLDERVVSGPDTKVLICVSAVRLPWICFSCCYSPERSLLFLWRRSAGALRPSGSCLHCPFKMP